MGNKSFVVILFNTILLFFGFNVIKAQDTINYKGDLRAPDGSSLILTLQIISQKDTVLLFMGSPMQTDKLFAATKSKFTTDSVKFNISNMGVRCRLKYINGGKDLQGSFKQGILNEQITFYRTEKLFSYFRPQTPKPPFEYEQKELTFKNPETEYTFHGTLTYPKKDVKYPTVVLVSGSGCQNRDEEIMGHKPFLVIADYLTKSGIAVFRYDDRGFASDDTNMYKGTTYDFAMDTRRAVEMLQNEETTDRNNIFILGHSEGGMICQILGAEYKDIKGLILMAAPTINGKDILLSQTEAILRLNSASESDINKALNEINGAKYDTNSINGKWLDYFCRFTPKEYLKKLTMPVLVLQGAKDMQVIADLNLREMRNYLPESLDNGNIKLYPNLNHLFQNCNTGNPSEYGLIEQTISPQVLEDIRNFVLKVSEQ